MKHVSRNNLSAALFLLATAASVESIADNNQYRWQDSQGNTVFSDRPPPKGEDYKVIDTGPNIYSVAPDESSTIPVSGAAKARSENNQELCQSAKMNLVALEGVKNLKVRDDQGEIKELSPEEREIAQRTAKAQVDVYCE